MHRNPLRAWGKAEKQVPIRPRCRVPDEHEYAYSCCFGPDARLFLFTGLLGGFTTFSAFGLEAMYLMRRGDLGIAAMYAGGSVVFGITAVWVGLRLVAMVPR